MLRCRPGAFPASAHGWPAAPASRQRSGGRGEGSGAKPTFTLIGLAAKAPKPPAGAPVPEAGEAATSGTRAQQSKAHHVDPGAPRRRQSRALESSNKEARGARAPGGPDGADAVGRSGARGKRTLL